MKKLVLSLLSGIILFAMSGVVAFAAVHVNGYYRANGTYVAPHYRSDPDGIVTNNWSYPGNTNPYTGVTAGGSVPSSSYTSYIAPATPSYVSVTGGYMYGTTLTCYSGYYKSGSACYKVPDHAYASGADLYCYSGYVARGSQCLTNTEDCQLSFGTNVTGVAGPSGNSSCTCNSGYEMNATKTACVLPSLSQTASASAYDMQHENLIAQITALLAQIEDLQRQLGLRK
jgi:hypothetical protein